MAALKRVQPRIGSLRSIPRKEGQRLTFCGGKDCSGHATCKACKRIYSREWRAERGRGSRFESAAHWRAANRILARWRRGTATMKPCEHRACPGKCKGRTQPFFGDLDRHPDVFVWLCPDCRGRALRGLIRP